MRMGIDIGSTTIKIVVIDENNNALYETYRRHHSKINESLQTCIHDVKEVLNIHTVQVAITGSAGMGLSEKLDIDFVQEVFATKLAADIYSPNTDVIIELGGEDAKILFLTSGLEVRMNGSCAGGTGAFIDQIATLLGISPDEMNQQSKFAKKVYPIASRCGVFAKSDIQPLLNQGANTEDLSISIFQSVVNQTITGLAQGRAIEGKVLYLGGPLTFLSELRNCFNRTLNLEGISPKHSLYYVALGCASTATTVVDLNELSQRLNVNEVSFGYKKTKPLFETRADYEKFIQRHEKHMVFENRVKDYQGQCHVGIDAGSTTIKMVVIDDYDDILFSAYQGNGGNPIPIIQSFLSDFYQRHPRAVVCSSTVTGYGEDMIKSAFSLDHGVVETIAHYHAAKHFNKDVDFIIDIGGQDIKCFKISQNGIDDLFLNEACSSGCGSFLQSFAHVLGYDMATFAKLGIFADSPVDLGSRCTVFMNSSVKQAQKDGASVQNISAGLSISVVKNAVYKVIRATKASELGKNIVVQGGTFLNDAVLRAFEQEIEGHVIRPNISGVMGAYGAALYGKNKGTKASSLLALEDVQTLKHETAHTHCKACENNCALTINTFDSSRKYISGNKCDKPIKQDFQNMSLNLYAYKQTLLQSYVDRKRTGRKGRIGIPLVLNMFELLPFWVKFFESLGYDVITSGFTTSETNGKGQHTIPSDTACFPAKLVHGHFEELMAQSLDAIFYPCMTYNLQENRGDNNYNCPVVAYYPENVLNNIPAVQGTTYIHDYVGLHRPKDFIKKIHGILNKHLNDITLKAVKQATKVGFEELNAFKLKIQTQGKRIVAEARQKHKEIIVLAGRPYHIDSKVNHGIDRLISSYGVAVISEDAIHHLQHKKVQVDVLNQWTYHSRLYDAASYVTEQSDMHLVQLVSFGCGVDAITTDEVNAILQEKKKIYTQLKIDEITNLGAAKIRIRSLLAAIDARKNNGK